MPNLGRLKVNLERDMIHDFVKRSQQGLKREVVCAIQLYDHCGVLVSICPGRHPQDIKERRIEYSITYLSLAKELLSRD